jgi:hypothetical protein
VDGDGQSDWFTVSYRPTAGVPAGAYGVVDVRIIGGGVDNLTQGTVLYQFSALPSRALLTALWVQPTAAYIPEERLVIMPTPDGLAVLPLDP